MVREERVAGAGADHEEPGGAHRYTMAEGPLASYERRVSVGAADGTGLVPVRQEVTFRVGVPYVSWIFALPLRTYLGLLGPTSRSPWWAPPQRLSHRGAVTLASLCALGVLAGYVDDLLPATMTYAGREYGVGDTGQGIALGLVQASSILALVLLARSDRHGRRRLILACTVAGAAVSAAGALSPSVGFLTATQVAAGAVLTAQYVLLGVMAIEEMPPGMRAWAIALLTMCYGLGGGFTLLALPLADNGPGGWRWLYAIALVAVPATAGCARHLPESRRWRAATPAPEAAPATEDQRRHWRQVGRRRRFGVGPTPAPAPRAAWGSRQRRRLLILGAGALLFALFDAPAGQFQNQYLRTQRHWSAARMSVVEQVAGTVGGAGTLVGGRLADTRGRRPVLAAALGLGTVVTLLQYFTRGVALDGWMTASSFVGYAVTPALAVYGGELFPTRLRATAGGVLTALAALGGLAGLAVTGVLASTFGTIGPALAVLAVGPMTLLVLVVLAYPETSGRHLEELNPEDAAFAEDG